MREATEANWFCENRGCGWSETLSLSDREQLQPRCICGRPLKLANPPLASPYLGFLRDEQSRAEHGPTQKE